MTQSTVSPSSSPARMVRIDLGGDTRIVPESQWKTAADALVAQHGGVPKVTYEPTGVTAPVPPVAAPPQDSAPPASDPEASALISIEGKQRSERDLAAAILAGFAPRQPLYDRGTPVVALGVENARKSRREYEELPLIRDACDDLINRIRRENRGDIETTVGSISMRDDGALLVDGEALYLGEGGFNQLTSRVGFGGGDYLRRCLPDLRAYNVNRWLDLITTGSLPEDRQRAFAGKDTVLKLRTRDNPLRPGGREVFAVVSKSYTSFDADEAAEVIGDALPSEARGEVTYDGFRTRWNVLYQTTVAPEKFVAGEFFRAGISLRTSDDGAGGLIGQAMLFQNLCLNLIIIDRSRQETLRAKHLGDPVRLARELKQGVTKGLAAIEPFLKAWGYATNSSVVEDAIKVDDTLVGRPVSEVIPGIFNGILERELVYLPGKRPENVALLVKAWEEDTSGARGDTRASVVNAFTRVAHTAPWGDPWLEDEIQASAHALIRGRGTDERAAQPLPYLELAD